MLGASIDVCKFSIDGGNAFFTKCAEYIEQKGELKKWKKSGLSILIEYT